METKNQASSGYSSRQYSKARKSLRLPKASLTVIDAPSSPRRVNAKARKGVTAGASAGKCVVCKDDALGRVNVGPFVAGICEGCAAMAQGVLKLISKAVRK